MARKKTETGKKNAAVRQAILDQFTLEPQPSRDEALKAVRKLEIKKGLKERDFDRWWDRFLGGNFSLMKKNTKVKKKKRGKERTKAMELDDNPFG